MERYPTGNSKYKRNKVKTLINNFTFLHFNGKIFAVTNRAMKHFYTSKYRFINEPSHNVSL